ncbi:MAG TPA: carboxylesterase [Gallionella sp.]|nr:carboxylesterase [Gallionella sp.]
MSENRPPIILQSGKRPQCSIIWLHGLGADGQDFVPVAEELDLPVAVRYVFPHAPMRPVTINGGYVMRAWYDIVGQVRDARQDEVGIRASQLLVEQLMAHEMENGILPDKIFLAGFSQGGAIALHTALRRTVPLAGVLALSTYLPLAESASREAQPRSRITPIFMAHGRNDPVIPFALGEGSRDMLRGLGYVVEWHEYIMQHSVCEQELRDIESWLTLQIKRAFS